MKAVVYTEYGPPEVMRVEDVEKPTPTDDEVLIRLEAVSLNRSDWENLIGSPLYTRIGALRKPRHPILGSDIAGRVEKVGGNVKDLKPGDAVFGDIMWQHMSGFAEYVCARPRWLARVPPGMTFADAAAMPQSAVIALQGIRDKGRVQPGQQVLINGAGGGGGAFYTWARRGPGPVVKTTGRRKGHKVWGLLEWFRGRLFYAGHEGRFTAAGYWAFLEQVLAQTRGPRVLVQAGARYHTAQATQTWVAAHADRGRVVQLPSYSPDYNPIAHVWRYVKQGTHWADCAMFAALQERVESRLRDLQADPLRGQQLLGTPLAEFIGWDALPLAA